MESGMGMEVDTEMDMLEEHRVLVGLEYTRNMRREQGGYCRRNETCTCGQA